MIDPVLRHLLDEATLPYRSAGRFAYHFARGKLRADPIFASLLRQGVLPAEARILDLGCGQAVFASWLLAARRLHERGRWPAAWPAPPRLVRLRGIELMASDVARAHHALGPAHPQVEIVQGDIRSASFGEADVVTILDVLHYLDYRQQEALLGRVRAALPAGGQLVTRIGDAAGGARFHICNAVDRCVTFVRGHRLPRMYCRPLREWTGLLERYGFSVCSQPMSHGKPFANVMLVARLP